MSNHKPRLGAGPRRGGKALNEAHTYVYGGYGGDGGGCRAAGIRRRETPPNSCGVGSPVSLAADRTRGLGLGGFGKFIHGAGFDNLGNELIQPVFHEPIQEACHLD
jgi:hypothetical protein